jgi:hypothetical protein
MVVRHASALTQEEVSKFHHKFVSSNTQYFAEVNSTNIY